MKDRRWNLTPIYPAVDSPEFNADLEKLKGMLKEFRAELESTKPDLAKLVEMENEMSDISETLGSYAYCNVSVNTTDKAAVNALNKVEELGMDEAEKISRLEINTYDLKVKSLEGTVQKVLVEEVNEQDSSLVSGKLANNVTVHFPGDESMIGKIVEVRLNCCKGFYFIGELA